MQTLVEHIAHAAHSGHYRHDGLTPYITHPKAVVAWLKKRGEEDQDVIDTAWGHDLFEDTKVTAGDLHQAGVNKRVIDAITALTKRDGQSYDDYLAGVKLNPIAFKVKLGDMISNLNDNPSSRAILKYAKGLQTLMNP